MCVPMWDMCKIDIPRKLCHDFDQSAWAIQDCFYLSWVHWYCICICSQRFKNYTCTNVPEIVSFAFNPQIPKWYPPYGDTTLRHISRISTRSHLPSQFSQKSLRLVIIDADKQVAMGIPQEQFPPAMIAGSPRGVKRLAPDQLSSPRRTKSVCST